MFASKLKILPNLIGHEGICVRPKTTITTKCNIFRSFLTSSSAASGEQFQKLHVGGDNFIAYRKHSPKRPSKNMGVMFCQGLMSNMCGLKAKFLENYCKGRNLNYICFDYIGHGQSSGQFEGFTISLWKENTLEILDKVAEGMHLRPFKKS